MSFVPADEASGGVQAQGRSRPEDCFEPTSIGARISGAPKVHQGGIAQRRLRASGVGRDQERLHLFLDLKHDLPQRVLRNLNFPVRAIAHFRSVTLSPGLAKMLRCSEPHSRRPANGAGRAPPGPVTTRCAKGPSAMTVEFIGSLRAVVAVQSPDVYRIRDTSPSSARGKEGRKA